MEPAAGQEADRAARFGVGWMVGTSLTTWLATAPVWLPVTVVGFLPWLLLQRWWIQHPAVVLGAPGATRLLLTGLHWLTLLGAGSVTSAVLCYAVVRRLQGVGAPFGECLRRGFGRLPHALGIGLTFMGIGVVVGVGAAALSPALGDWAVILAVLPGGWLMTTWGLALPAAVTERLRLVAALGRSAALTRGRRWALIGSWFLLWLVISLPLALLQDPSDRRKPAPTREVEVAEALHRTWLAGGVLGLTCSLLAVSVGVAYVGLRREKDGVSFAQLVQAFE